MVCPAAIENVSCHFAITGSQCRVTKEHDLMVNKSFIWASNMSSRPSCLHSNRYGHNSTYTVKNSSCTRNQQRLSGTENVQPNSNMNAIFQEHIFEKYLWQVMSNKCLFFNPLTMSMFDFSSMSYIWCFAMNFIPVSPYQQMQPYYIYCLVINQLTYDIVTE